MRTPGALLALVLAGLSSAHAVTLHVPAAYPTVGAALAAAAPGDTVRIAPGRYPEYGLTLPGGVTMLGETTSGGETWLDGVYSGIPILAVPAGATPVEIRAITFRYGSGSPAGALRIAAGTARHTVVGCTFDRCKTRAVDAQDTDLLDCLFTLNIGGGLTGSNLRVSGCTFRENSAAEGAGLWVSPGLIEACRFERNTASSRGGALRTQDATVHDCLFEGNRATAPTSAAGGAFYGTGPLTLERCTFLDNAAGKDGGAVWLSGHPSTVRQCRFLDNGAQRGGGIFASGIGLTVEGCSFLGNGATEGGSVYAPTVATRTLTLRRTVMQQGTSGAAVAAAATAPAPVVEACDVFANAGGDWAGPLAGLGLSSGNFSANAFFCDTPRESLFVSSASPLLPANNPAGVLIGAGALGCPAEDVIVSAFPPGLPIEVDGLFLGTPAVVDWPEGTVHTITAPDAGEPAPGTRLAFVSWSDGGERSHDVIAPAPPAEFRATFDLAYFLDVQADPGGSAVPASGWHAALAPVALHAEAEPGYRTAGWAGTGPGSYTGPLADAVVTMQGPITQRALFDSIGYHPLTMLADAGGTVSPASGPYTVGTVVPIRAFPDSGFVFFHWIGTGNGSFSGEGAEAQVTMNGPITQRAVFATSDSTVHVEILAVGDGSTFPPSGEYPARSPLNLHVVPAPGSTFDRWLGEGAGSYTGPEGSATIIPLGPITQTAYFAPGGVYPLIVTATPGGVVGPPSGDYPAGSVLQLSATPATGFRFVEWQGEGLDAYSGTDPVATIAMHSPITEHAVFERLPGVIGYEFSLSASGTDPFANEAAPTGQPRELHLWLTCARIGLSAFEGRVDGTAALFGFNPAPGVFNIGTGGDLLLAIEGCPTGEDAEVRLGSWYFVDSGAEFCLAPSLANGVLAAVDCGTIPGTWSDPGIRGFSSTGSPPCRVAGANGCGGPGTAIGSAPAPVPSHTALTAIAPNPFRGTTAIRFALAAPCRARVAVYDVAGRLLRVLRDGDLPAGEHGAVWDPRAGSPRAAGGVYFVRFDAGDRHETRRVVFLGEEH